MIVDFILRFEAQSVAEGQIGPDSPIILPIYAGIEYVNAHQRLTACLRKLGRAAGQQTGGAIVPINNKVLIGRDRRKREYAIEIFIRSDGIRRAAQPCSELDEMFALGQRRIVLQFVAVFMLDRTALLITAARE